MRRRVVWVAGLLLVAAVVGRGAFRGRGLTDRERYLELAREADDLRARLVVAPPGSDEWHDPKRRHDARYAAALDLSHRHPEWPQTTAAK